MVHLASFFPLLSSLNGYLQISEAALEHAYYSQFNTVIFWLLGYVEGSVFLLFKKTFPQPTQHYYLGLSGQFSQSLQHVLYRPKSHCNMARLQCSWAPLIILFSDTWSSSIINGVWERWKLLGAQKLVAENPSTSTNQQGSL